MTIPTQSTAVWIDVAVLLVITVYVRVAGHCEPFTTHAAIRAAACLDLHTSTGRLRGIQDLLRRLLAIDLTHIAIIIFFRFVFFIELHGCSLRDSGSLTSHMLVLCPVIGR